MLFHLFVAVCCTKIGASITEISSRQPFHYNKEIFELSANLYFLFYLLFHLKLFAIISLQLIMCCNKIIVKFFFVKGT